MKLALSFLAVALFSSALAQRSPEANAFDHYGFAIQRAAELKEEDWMLQARLRVSPAVISLEEPAVISLEEEEEYRERWMPVVDAVEQGAASTRVVAPGNALYFEWGLSEPFHGLRGALNATVLEMRRALREGDLERGLQLSASGAEYAADLLHQPRVIDKHIALALCFIALPEAWRDEDLKRLDAESAAALDRCLAEFENRLPRELEGSPETDPLGHLQDPLATMKVVNESLCALRIQLRFLRLAIALHQGQELPLFPDEPSGTLRVDAAADGQFILRSEFTGSRRRPYSRTVTLR